MLSRVLKPDSTNQHLHFYLQGKFLQTSQLAGNWYGVTREAVENVAREGLAAVFHMDLEVGK